MPQEEIQFVVLGIMRIRSNEENKGTSLCFKSSVEVSLAILVYQLPDIKADDFDPESRKLNF